MDSPMISLPTSLIEALSGADISFEERFFIICRGLTEFFGAPRCCVFRRDDGNYCLLTGFPEEDHTIGFRIPCETHLPLQQAFRGQQIVVIEDTQTDERLTDSMREWARTHRTKSIIFIPIVLKGEILGIIVLDIAPERDFSTDDISVLNMVALFSSLVINDARMFEKIEGLNAELVRRQKQLLASTKFASIGWVAAKMGHRFLNELPVLRGGVRDLSEAPPEERMNIAQLSFQRIISLERVVRDFMDFARKRSDAGPLLVNNALKKILYDFQGNDLAAFPDIKLNIRLGEVVPMIFMASAEFGIIIESILVNAREAIVEDDSDGEITVFSGGSSENGGFATVVISNTCKRTIPEEVLDRMFSPFFTTKNQEMGLGLHVVYELLGVESKVFVTSSEGKTTFTLMFPVFNPDRVD